MSKSHTLVAALALTIVSIFFSPRANAGLSFAKPTSMAVLEGADGVAFGDFNEDGKADMVVWAAANLEVAFGDGEGKFHNSEFYPTSLSAVFVIPADFNGDGHLDLAVLESYNGISLFLGNGHGGFQSPIMSSSQVQGYPSEMTSGDFNADGILDLAVASSCMDTNCTTSGGYFVLLGNGDGTFYALPPVQILFERALAVVTDDFNGDGKLDLAISGSLLVTALGNGDGTFQPVVSYTSDFFDSSSLAARDFNRDGRIDLATVCYRNGLGLDAVEVRLGNADGTFQLPVSSPSGGSALLPSLQVADFDQDGNLDVVVINGRETTVNVLLGNGNGKFRRPVPFGVGRPNLEFIALADLNGDGKADVITLDLGPHEPFAFVLLNTSTQP